MLTLRVQKSSQNSIGILNVYIIWVTGLEADTNSERFGYDISDCFALAASDSGASETTCIIRCLPGFEVIPPGCQITRPPLSSVNRHDQVLQVLLLRCYYYSQDNQI
jgi:hypothetical protein